MVTPIVDAPFDAHVHLRQGEEVSVFAPYSARTCADIVVMPNTRPPVWDRQSLVRYREEITPHLPGCTPHLMAKLLPETTPAIVEEVAAAGAVGFKLYPRHATTNSEDGIPRALLSAPMTAYPDPAQRRFLEVLRAIAEHDLVLSIHGELAGPPEDPEDELLERERRFLGYIPPLLGVHPALRIVLEHITTEAAVQSLRSWTGTEGRPYFGRLAATITPHHLQKSLNDLAAGGLRPSLYCMPLVKYKRDRRALVEAATGHEDWAFLGTDTAPHPTHKKYCEGGCAGVFNAICAVESVWEVFYNHFPDHAAATVRFQDFTSRRGRAFYRLRLPERRIQLVPEPWQVPEQLTVERLLSNYRPYRAGELLPWAVQALNWP